MAIAVKLRPIKSFLATVMLLCLIFVNSIGALCPPAVFAGEEVSAGASPTYIFGELKPVPAGSSLYAVPVLLPGKAAWVSVLGPSGKPLPDVSVLVEGVVFNTDTLGQAVIEVPKTQAVTLSLLDSNKNILQEKKY